METRFVENKNSELAAKTPPLATPKAPPILGSVHAYSDEQLSQAVRRMNEAASPYRVLTASQMVTPDGSIELHIIAEPIGGTDESAAREIARLVAANFSAAMTANRENEVHARTSGEEKRSVVVAHVRTEKVTVTADPLHMP
jgi:hypothetical protein